MLKNNKILKAQMGVSLPFKVIGRNTGNIMALDKVLNPVGTIAKAGSAATATYNSPVNTIASMIPTSIAELPIIPLALAAYAMTKPHSASAAVQIAHENQLAKEKEAAIKKEQEYWNNKAAFYSNALSNGAIMTPTGVVITDYNPSTRTFSAYKDVRNGDRIFLDKNLQTGVYSNPVYKDAKTGAYYEGVLDLNGDIPLVERGENLMPYSIIPLEKPEWMVSNPSDVLNLPVPIVYKKNKQANTQTSSAKSTTSESAPVNPKSPNEEDKENKKSNEDNNSNKNYNDKGYKTSSVEEWMYEFPEKINSYRRWRLGNFERVWHNKQGNISWNGTKLINRGATSTNTGQSPSLWGTKLKWGIGGAGLGYGIYSLLNNEPVNLPKVDGDIVYDVNEASKQATNTLNNSSNDIKSNNKHYTDDQLDF